MNGMEFLREVKKFNAERRDADMFTSATKSPLLPPRPSPATSWIAPSGSMLAGSGQVRLLEPKDPLVPIDTASAPCGK
ncbi:MAG: hypothetical protein ACRDRG_01580 [Pseudonocardiaceae bacterium]